MPVTDEDIVRDLLQRYTAHVESPDSVATSIATQVAARQHRLDRRRRVASLTATGAALATAAGVIAVVPGHASHAPGITPPATSTPTKITKQPLLKLTAEQRKLSKLSSVAASQPPGQGRYVVMMTGGIDVKDATVIDSRTGDMWSYQQGTDGNPSGGGPVTKHYSPTAAQLAAMPTSAAALRAALIARWNAENKPVKDDPLQKMLAKRHIHPIPITVSSDDKVFQQATYLLWNPLVGPALRSALYRVLVTVPGVKVNSSARDANGRPAVEITRTDTSGLPGGKSDGDAYETYESPATGTLLETAVTYPPGTGMTSIQDPNGTRTEVDETVYLSITRTSTVPPNPYGG
jgi:hypothetical protein